MQKLIAGLIFVGLMAPAFASAATVQDLENQVMYLLGQVAFLKSQSVGTPVECALVVSRASAKVGEPFELIWNTYGALSPSNNGTSQYAQNGVQSVTLGKSGIFEYKMTFNGQNASQTTCKASVSILP